MHGCPVKIGAPISAALPPLGLTAFRPCGDAEKMNKPPRHQEGGARCHARPCRHGRACPGHPRRSAWMPYETRCRADGRGCPEQVRARRSKGKSLVSLVSWWWISASLRTRKF